MPNKTMFVPRSAAITMFGNFLMSKKFKYYHHLTKLGSIYKEYFISSLIEVTNTFVSQFPNLGGVKIYFASDPQGQSGQADIQMLICPVINDADVPNTYLLLSKYDALLESGDPDAFNKAKMTTQEAKPWSIKYRDEFARKPDAQQGQAEDTRSIFYELNLWNWLINFLKLLFDLKVKAYLVNNMDGGLNILFTLQKNGEDILVESIDAMPDDIFRLPRPAEFSKNGIFTFDTGNPCPPGSIDFPNLCRGNGLEP